jgi:hypothetical protein
MAAAFDGHAMNVEYQELITCGVWRGGGLPREGQSGSRHVRRCWAGEMEERHVLGAVDDEWYVRESCPWI